MTQQKMTTHPPVKLPFPISLISHLNAEFVLQYNQTQLIYLYILYNTYTQYICMFFRKKVHKQKQNEKNIKISLKALQLNKGNFKNSYTFSSFLFLFFCDFIIFIFLIFFLNTFFFPLYFLDEKFYKIKLWQMLVCHNLFLRLLKL